MASNGSAQGWSTWSLSTRVVVGIGAVLATVLVVVLYLPR
jgi:hypothetical protein